MPAIWTSRDGLAICLWTIEGDCDGGTREIQRLPEQSDRRVGAVRFVTARIPSKVRVLGDLARSFTERDGHTQLGSVIERTRVADCETLCTWEPAQDKTF
jgi:hypothetical protein